MTHLADDLFDAYRAFSTVDWKIFEKLVELFGEDSIADTAHDSYDTSLEIYADKDIVPTAEQAATIISWGFSRFWINFKDDSEIHVYGTHIGERRKRSYQKWGEARSKTRAQPEGGTQSLLRLAVEELTNHGSAHIGGDYDDTCSACLLVEEINEALAPSPPLAREP